MASHRWPMRLDMSDPPKPDPIAATIDSSFKSGVSSRSSSRILNRGDRLGRFQIKRQLGVGGMGAVYLGFDPDLEREVAIKVLTVAVCGDPTALTRFRAEAQAAGNLNHPNVVAVYEIGDDQGFPYIVMEYVPSGSVIDLLRRESPLDLVEATRIIVDASRGIAAAHAKGLIHRDIKPANLMVSSDRTIKVADFGLARAHNRNADANVTQEGQILGTPHFMSPEQCQGGNLDARSDLYALGATYFMLLTGVSPYHHAGSTMSILAAHINEAPPDPKQLNQNVPAPCVRIIHRLLAKAPDHRYASAELLLADLEAVLKIVKDPNTATEVRYRGSVQIPREAFDLPSEVSGTMSRQVDPGGTVTTKLAAKGDDSEAGSSRPRSWFGRRSQSQDGPAASKPSSAQSSPQSSPDRGPAVSPSVDAPSSEQAAASSRKKSAVEGYRKEVFSVKHGRFILRWPERITESEAAEVQEWLEMMGKKMRRIAGENSGLEADKSDDADDSSLD